MKPDASFIEKYLERYSQTQGVLPEKIDDFGKSYGEKGFLSREELYELAYESSTRSAYHVRKNPEERCRKVTENIRKLEDDFSKIALISSLKGFKAPTGSCVLTALNPEMHAIVDTRVWASLERLGRLEGRKESFGPEDYIVMIREIRGIADKTGFSTAKVGYALFSHDEDVRAGTLH